MRGDSGLRGCLWAATSPPLVAHGSPLDQAVHADVVVLGAGYTGLSSALHLAKRGIRVAILEAREPGWGGSGRSAGHCTPTFVHHLPKDVAARLGPPWGPRFVRLQADAANLVFGLVRDYGIDCEATQNGYLKVAHAAAAMEHCRRECEQYAALGKPVSLLDRADVAALTGSEQYYGGWTHKEGGHLNPLAYVRGLAHAAVTEGARLFVESAAQAVARDGGRWRVSTAKGYVLADQVIVATGASTAALWPELAHSCVVLIGYCLATTPLDTGSQQEIIPGGHTVVDTRRDTHFFKVDAHRRIVTGGIVEGWRGRFPDATKRLMSARLRQLFPQAGRHEWPYYWYGDMEFVPGSLPRLYELAPGVVAALGYSGRGVPTATAFGRVLADLVSGTPAADLPLPLTRPRRFRGRRLVAALAPCLLGPLYRYQDRRLMRRRRVSDPTRARTLP